MFVSIKNKKRIVKHIELEGDIIKTKSYDIYQFFTDKQMII
jgi:hypothetical protein